MLLRRAVAAVLDGTDGLAQLFAAGDDAVHAVFLHLFAGHRIERDGHRRAAAHRDSAGQLLRPLVRDRLKDAAIALFIRQGHRGRPHAADGERDHLQLRERTAHAVNVDERQAEARRCGDGQHGIDTAGLNGHEGIDLFAEEARDHVIELLIFRAADGLLGQNGRRAHHGDGDDQRVVRDLLRVQKRHRAARLHSADGNKLSDIRVAAAACTEKRCAGRDIFDLRDTDFTHDNTPYFLRLAGE